MLLEESWEFGSRPSNKILKEPGRKEKKSEWAMGFGGTLREKMTAGGVLGGSWDNGDVDVDCR